jgi:hypothetical protein
MGFWCGAVVRHCAVAIKAGDGAEARADEMRLTRACRADLLINRDFCDRSCPSALLEPTEKFTQRCTVLFHRFTDKLRFTAVFRDLKRQKD